MAAKIHEKSFDFYVLIHFKINYVSTGNIAFLLSQKAGEQYSAILSYVVLKQLLRLVTFSPG